MANPSILSADTILYCPAEPDGRMFPAGSPWPGDAWSANRGGEPVGENAAAGALKDLIKAQDAIDAQSAQLASKDHDLAQLAAARDEATGKLADAEQRAVAAETAKAEAEEASRGYMTDRDQAREELQGAREALSGAKADLEAAQAEAAKIPDLVGQLETANQTIADLNDKLAVKPGKAVKTDSTAAPEGAEAPDAT